MSDIPPLPEGAEKAVLAYGLKSQDFQVRLVDACDLVTALEGVRRAVAAALLEARGAEHEHCCDRCISSDKQRDDCKRRQWLRAQAAALEADGSAK